MSEKLNPLPQDLIWGAAKVAQDKIHRDRGCLLLLEDVVFLLQIGTDHIRETSGWKIEDTTEPGGDRGWQGDTPRKEGDAND